MTPMFRSTTTSLLATSLQDNFRIAPQVLVAAGVATAVVVLLLAVGKVPLSYNIRNLSLRWKTTVMTALAFTLVIGLLTVMLAFVNGMARLTEGSGQPGNVLILAEGATDESFSTLGYSDIGDIVNQPGVRRLDGQPLVSRETYLIVNQPIARPQPGRPNRRFVQVRGIEDPVVSGAVHGLGLFPEGHWFSTAGVQELKTDGGVTTVVQGVLGEGMARVMAQDRSPEEQAAARHPDRLDTGDFFTLGGRQWIVTGIMQSSGSTFDSEVWAKQALIGPTFGKNTYSSLVARTADAKAAQKFKEFLNKDYKKASLAAQVETEYFASLSKMNQQFLFATMFVAAVMAVGGVFGVMNTMFAAIAQRTKDIGVLRLLGFKRWQILVSFLLESVVLGLIGGTLGCLLGTFSDGWSATSVVGGGMGAGKSVVLHLSVDANIIAVGLLLTLAMGFIGGLIPAISAIRLRPLDALR